MRKRARAEDRCRLALCSVRRGSPPRDCGGYRLIDWRIDDCLVKSTGARSPWSSHGCHPVRAAGCLHGVSAGAVGEFSRKKPLSPSASSYTHTHTRERAWTNTPTTRASTAPSASSFSATRCAACGLSTFHFEIERDTPSVFNGFAGLQMLGCCSSPNF